jgi:hypothetical protein
MAVRAAIGRAGPKEENQVMVARKFGKVRSGGGKGLRVRARWRLFRRRSKRLRRVAAISITILLMISKVIDLAGLAFKVSEFV